MGELHLHRPVPFFGDLHEHDLLGNPHSLYLILYFQETDLKGKKKLSELMWS